MSTKYDPRLPLSVRVPLEKKVREAFLSLQEKPGLPDDLAADPFQFADSIRTLAKLDGRKPNFGSLVFGGKAIASLLWPALDQKTAYENYRMKFGSGKRIRGKVYRHDPSPEDLALYVSFYLNVFTSGEHIVFIEEIFDKERIIANVKRTQREILDRKEQSRLITKIIEYIERLDARGVQLLKNKLSSEIVETLCNRTS